MPGTAIVLPFQTTTSLIQNYGISLADVAKIRKEKDNLNDLQARFGKDESKWNAKFGERLSKLQSDGVDAGVIQKEIQGYRNQVNGYHWADSRIHDIEKQISDKSGMNVKFGVTRRAAKTTLDWQKSAKLLNMPQSQIDSIQRNQNEAKYKADTDKQIEAHKKMFPALNADPQDKARYTAAITRTKQANDAISSIRAQIAAAHGSVAMK